MGYKTTYIDGDLALGRNADIGGDVDIHGMARVKRHLKVEGFLDAPNIKGALKGFFRNEDELQKEFPKPRPGWMAIVLEGESVERGFVHVVKDGAWEQVGEEAKPLELVIDSLNVYSTKTELASTEEELLKRLQGVSENSNASTDPFKFLGDFNSIEDLEGVLDGMMSSVRNHVGIFRAVVSTRVITIVNNPISAGDHEYNQMIMGCLRIKDNGKLEEHGQSFNVLYRISYNGEWLKWDIANNKIIEEMHNTLKDCIDNEEARAQRAEEELLKRLQGVSENSNASTDPFRYLGNLSKTKFFETIDALNGDSVASREKCAGHFRAAVEHRIVDVYSEQIGWANNVWVQRMVCPMQLFNEVAQKEDVYTKTGVDKDGNTVYYKYRTHTYTQNFDTLTGASTNQNTVKTYTRTCNNGVWGDWKDVSNNYINSQNYGKKIAFFGGSFAQNMSLTSTPWPFDYQGRTYSLLQYIAEKLGATSFDDYAVGSQGVIVGDIPIIEQLQTAGAGYDIYVIFGGINDFGNEIPLGESNGAADDTTYCGGLKAAFDWIRSNNKSAKIYTVTPFKAYKPDDRYWNPRSNIKKNGHTFYEFIQAQKEVAQIHGVPCFDLWANQQFSGASASEHYYTDLVHPNGKGYQAVADALVEFLAYGLGSGVLDAYAVLPNATDTTKGLMSAEDKSRLAIGNSYAIKESNTLQDAINALNNIIPNEDKRSGVRVAYTDSNNAVHTYTFMSDIGFTNPTRWKSDVVNPYIDSEQPVGGAYRLSDVIDYINVVATGAIDVDAVYSFGVCGYLTSVSKYGLQILKDREPLGNLYLDPATLTGTLTAGNLIIEVKVNTLKVSHYDGLGNYDYSRYYNRITPQLFINAKIEWETATLENKNTSNDNKIKRIEKNVFEMSKELVDVTYKNGYYNTDKGVYVADTSRCCTDKIDVVPGEKYFVTVNIGGSGVIAYLAQWNNDAWVGIADDFKANSGNAVEREYVVPEGVTHIAVCSYNTTPPTLEKSVVGDSTTFYTKDETYNRDEIDGMIANPPSGGSVDSNLVNNVESITLNVEDNAITEAVMLGTGWSGNLANGYAHTSGNTEPLEFNLPYASGDKFILEFKCDGVNGDSTDLLIAVGDTPTVKSYNGGSNFRIGFVANGGRLKINPANNFASTITDIAIRKISSNGNSTITINVGDVYSQANAMITAFWNIAIGSKDATLSKLINGSRNVAIGRNTLNSVTSGNRNIAIGTFAMPFLTEAEENVAIGADTIYPLTKAFGCVGIGKATLSGTQKAEYCVAVGKQAMGTYNLSKDRTKCTAIGVSAGPSITDSCTHVGYRAGANVAGAKNTSIGYGSMAVGERSTVDITGEELTCIGYYSQIDNTDEAKSAKNSTAIGANTKITKSNQVVIGNANVEEVVIAGKRIIFHADGSVKWENV